MKYLFSVIIPIYNSEKFLRQAINSVLNQKKKNTEIILVNDASTDQSLEICNSYKKKYNLIKIINHKKNLGVATSRNTGILKSNGNYLIFLDSDDELFDNALDEIEKIIKKKKNLDVVLVKFQKNTFPYSNYNFIKNNEKNTKNKEKIINYILNNQIQEYGLCFSYIVRKKFLLKNKIYFPNVHIGEDDLYVAKIMCLMKNYAFNTKNFYLKKDRDFSLSHSKDFYTTLTTLHLLFEFVIFDKNTFLSKSERKYINSCIQYVFGIFAALIILRKNSELKIISNYLKRNKNNISDLVKLPENLNLNSLLNKYGSYKGLLQFRNMIISSKIELVKKINPEYKSLYIYCRSKFTDATVKILKKNSYTIKGIIDDNENFVKKKYLKYKTISSFAFLNKFKNNLSKLVLIIVNQKSKTLQSIYKKLLKKGFKKNQLLMIKY